MSIRERIQTLCGDGRLFDLGLTAGFPATRQIYASWEINNFLVGPSWESREVEIRAGRLAADLVRFLRGDIITVAAQPGPGKAAYMSRLDPEQAEVWDIRSVDPSPAIRVLGRFAGKDLFVALTWHWRRDLKDRTTPDGVRRWRRAIAGCKAEWRKLFGPYPPLSNRSYPHDYISNADVVGRRT